MLRASLPSTIEMRYNLDPLCGLVLAEPVQLSQILMNLSSNAFEALGATGGVSANRPGAGAPRGRGGRTRR